MVIVYRSNTGFTQEYANMLAKAEKIRCYELGAEIQPPEEEEVLYMGPLMAGHIAGLDQAMKRYRIKGICGVGISEPGEQVLGAIAQGNYTGGLPVFYLRGGWAPQKVGWLKRRMVGMATRSIRQRLQERGSRRTPEEEKALRVLVHGGSYVAYENLAPIQSWLKEQ